MKRHYLKMLLPILSTTLLGYAATKENNTIHQTKEPHFIQYHNRVILFSPFHQGYERIKPDAFYAGVEGFLAYCDNKERNNFLLNTEVRMGYNFFLNGRDHLTPIAGVGFVENFFRHHKHTQHKPGIVYGTMGFLYDHEFNTIFNLGINVKFLVGGPIGKKHFEWGSPVVGTDISLPITFRFGRHRHWDCRIEPFNMYLHGSHGSQNYSGFRNSLGYRF